jgi:hypothetical protein
MAFAVDAGFPDVQKIDESPAKIRLRTAGTTERTHQDEHRQDVRDTVGMPQSD